MSCAIFCFYTSSVKKYNIWHKEQQLVILCYLFPVYLVFCRHLTWRWPCLAWRKTHRVSRSVFSLVRLHLLINLEQSVSLCQKYITSCFPTSYWIKDESVNLKKEQQLLYLFYSKEAIEFWWLLSVKLKQTAYSPLTVTCGAVVEVICSLVTLRKGSYHHLVSRASLASYLSMYK